MSTWTSDELNRIAGADELAMAPRRRDGTLRRPVPIWVVGDGDNLYVRSYRGVDGAWWRTVRTSHRGHISSAGVDKDVALVEETEPDVNDRIDAAYRTKYGRFGGAYVEAMIEARSTTLRLRPL